MQADWPILYSYMLLQCSIASSVALDISALIFFFVTCLPTFFFLAYKIEHLVMKLFVQIKGRFIHTCIKVIFEDMHGIIT